jgi:amidohydrolase
MVVAGGCGAPARARSATPGAGLGAEVDALYPDLEKLYIELHRAPELSNSEEHTAARLARRLRDLGFEVVTGLGGHGVLGALRNGSGPTVLVRTDMDALPLEEKTGLPYASTVRSKDAKGNDVGVMHACGHDLHMSAWVGVATLLARHKDRWRGTVLFMGEPAEEVGTGAKSMIAAGLLTRFGRPDFALGFHDSADLPAGTVSVKGGYVFANVDSVDLTLYGKGGHGAAPQLTVDPIVIAARTIVALQTLVARENDPRDPAVVTVGSVHGGTTHNVIPDEVRLQLTVRSYKDDVRRQLLAGIERIARAEAQAANAPKPPVMAVTPGPPAAINDSAVAKRVTGALKATLGESNVQEGREDMVAEDFGELGRAGIPAVMFRVGAAKEGAPKASLHSATFAPDLPKALRIAVLAETAAALELLGRSR